MKSPAYFGDYKMQEAGDDTMSMEAFEGCIIFTYNLWIHLFVLMHICLIPFAYHITSHHITLDLFEAHKNKLSHESDLFVEDMAVGTFGCVRIGVRVVSSDASYALIARSLLVPIPPRDCDHRAR